MKKDFTEQGFEERQSIVTLNRKSALHCLNGMILCTLFGFISYSHSAFECSRTDSSFVNEVCYDADRTLLRIQLKTRYYNYCNVPTRVVNALLNANSKGRYYNTFIKGKYRC